MTNMPMPVTSQIQVMACGKLISILKGRESIQFVRKIRFGIVA